MRKPSWLAMVVKLEPPTSLPLWASLTTAMWAKVAAKISYALYWRRSDSDRLADAKPFVIRKECPDVPGRRQRKTASRIRGRAEDWLVAVEEDPGVGRDGSPEDRA